MSNIYQVGIECPFAKEIRKPFDRLKKEIESETPLSMVLADTIGLTSSDYLLGHITELIRESAACIFDATGANPDVSLEVGIAHAIPVDFLLALKTRKKKKDAGAQPDLRSIISDLQGKNRIEYKSFDALEDQVTKRSLDMQPFIIGRDSNR